MSDDIVGKAAKPSDKTYSRDIVIDAIAKSGLVKEQHNKLADAIIKALAKESLHIVKTGQDEGRERAQNDLLRAWGRWLIAEIEWNHSTGGDTSELSN